MLDLLDLVDNQLDTLHESLGVMIMQYVHVDALITARKECIAVLVGLDAASYSCKYKCSGVDGFEVATRHLQNDRVDCGHNSDQLCAAFDASAALVGLRLIARHFKL